MNDYELLRRFANESSEEAFRQLVERHGGMVYGVALRQLHPHQAEEVTQAVFEALAKKAVNLSASTILAGWLFRAARFAAMKLQRDEQRRQRREQKAALEKLQHDDERRQRRLQGAAMMIHAQSENEADDIWDHVVPLLDGEIEALSDKDRSAVLLRFYENCSFKEVGEALGTSEDAAKMRVSRALEKLRQRLFKRGTALTIATLTGVLGSQAMTVAASAPPELAIAVTKTCVANGISSELVKAIARKSMWWKWKPFVIGVSLAVVLGMILFLSLRGRNDWVEVPANAPAWPVQD
jgi:RNA polymerase sigma factor (sigma-70 family)